MFFDEKSMQLFKVASRPLEFRLLAIVAEQCHQLIPLDSYRNFK